MKNKLLIAFASLSLLTYSVASLSSEKHDDHADEHEEHGDHEEHDAHEKEDTHAHEEGEEHGHDEEKGHEEASASIGPDKGITEKSENGFKLSAEAVKTMEIQFQEIKGSNLSIDKKTLVLVKDEKSVFRLRDNWIKRVHVNILNKSNNMISISSESLQSGDQIVTNGTGFLRMAEIFATEGASHGHSH